MVAVSPQFQTTLTHSAASLRFFQRCVPARRPEFARSRAAPSGGHLGATRFGFACVKRRRGKTKTDAPPGEPCLVLAARSNP
jgi:hypothetical protein